MPIFLPILTHLYSNAAYHVTEATLKHLAFLNVPVIFSGPYSKYPHLHLTLIQATQLLLLK